MPDEKGFLFRTKIRRRALRMFQKEVADLSRSDFLQLQQERRSKVERGFDRGELLQPIGHIVVGLSGVQAHPGHTGRPRDRVRVIGLMHMPEKTDVGSLHRRILLSTWQASGKLFWCARTLIVRMCGTTGQYPLWILKKAAARLLCHVESLSEARTPLAEFFSILLNSVSHRVQGHAINSEV